MNHESEQYQMYFGKISASAKRMSELISDLLSYSRVSKKGNEFVQVDLNEIMQKIESDFELLVREKSATIICDKLPVIKGIPIQINQLLFNLIGNALKFNDKPTARISVTCKELSSSEQQTVAGLSRAKTYYKLVVSDNGIGFSNEYKDRIFTIFQRLNDGGRYEGTGIGLAICRKIVENHNGHISASGVEGEGAEFFVYLPKS
jgi:two-component system CheB/CheR fusion protein